MESLLRLISDGRQRNLVFCLFVSGLLHLLLVFFLHFGSTTGKVRAVVSRESIRVPILQVQLGSADIVLSIPPGGGDVPSRMHEQQGDVAGALEKKGPDILTKEGGGLFLAPDVYYPISDLTAPPRALGDVELDPYELTSVVASGKIILILWINEHGAVVNVVVQQSDLPDDFSQVATKAFEQLRFVPGELSGQKVGAMMRVEVRYDDDRVMLAP